MRPVKLTMQAFGSYGKLTQIDFREPNQNLFLELEIPVQERRPYLMLLYLPFTAKPVPVPIKKRVLYCRASMWN